MHGIDIPHAKVWQKYLREVLFFLVYVHSSSTDCDYEYSRWIPIQRLPASVPQSKHITR